MFVQGNIIWSGAKVNFLNSLVGTVLMKNLYRDKNRPFIYP